MNRRGWLLLVLAASLWGASYLFIKVALDDGVSEAFIVFARCALGAAVLVPLAIRAGVVGDLLDRGWWNLWLALVQAVVPFFLITVGERWVPTGMAGVLVATAPLFVALLALGIDHEERSEGWALVGVLTGMVGVVLLFGVDLSGDANTLIGGAMILGAALAYAIAAFIVKRRFKGVAPVGVAASTILVSAIVTLPAALLSLPTHGPGIDSVGSLIVLGAGGTGIAFYAYYVLIDEFGPGRASVIAYVAPAFAVAYGILLLGESLTVGVVIGLSAILAGSFLVGQGRAPSLPRRTVAVPVEA